ncbi:MAG: flagellar hook-associated protein FlgK [Anaerolineaceae bacterium]
MPSFSGIYVALQSILAQQKAMEITEHNVANANTVGYHRQEAVFKAGVPEKAMGMMQAGGVGDMGTGVLVDSIRRYSLEYYDVRYRNETAMTSQYSAAADVLKMVEISLSDTADDSIGNLLDRFFASWQTVSADPDLTTLRDVLVSDAKALAEGFNQRYQGLLDLRTDKNLEVKQLADEVNTAAAQIAKLNEEIGRSLASGNQPNDLLDERDRQISRIAEITGIQSHVQENGQVIASINGHAIVVGNKTFSLTTSTDADGLTQIGWEDGQTFAATSGKIAGIIDVRDRVIPEQMDQLNQTAKALMDRVNTLHLAGYDLEGNAGVAMFTYMPGQEALSMAVNSVLDDPLKVAAATTTNAPGDGNNALAISNVYDELLMNSNTISLRQYNGERVTKMALETRSAKTAAANHQNVADALKDQLEEVGGVSLDEEAANMVKYQRSYQAAVRLMTVFDEMLEQMITSMGVVGR